MAVRSAAATAIVIALLVAVATGLPGAAAAPKPPRPCGSLNLASSLTQHCFPADGEGPAHARPNHASADLLPEQPIHQACRVIFPTFKLSFLLLWLAYTKHNITLFVGDGTAPFLVTTYLIRPSHRASAAMAPALASRRVLGGPLRQYLERINQCWKKRIAVSSL